MKKKIWILALCVFCAMSGCHNDKADEKAKQAEVFKVHDEVMGISEKLVTNKIALDSIVKKGVADTTKNNLATVLIKQLTTADDAMDKWMHNFNPDYTGKSHQEIMTYLDVQHKEILHIDTMIKVAIDQSNQFLKAK